MLSGKQKLILHPRCYRWNGIDFK